MAKYKSKATKEVDENVVEDVDTETTDDTEDVYDWDTEAGITKLVKGYDHAVSYARPLWERRIRNFNILIGKIRQKKYKSKANFHVPYAQTLLEIVYSLLVANEPRGVIQPRVSDDDRDAADLMQQLVTYALDVNDYDRLFPMGVKESMQLDTAWARVSWEYLNKDTDHPKIELQDTFQVLAHPRKIKLDDRWPLYLFSEMTKAEMRARGWNKNRIRSLSDSKMKDDEWRRKRLQSLGYLNSMPYDDDTDLYPVIEVFCKCDLGDKEKGEEQAYFVIGNESTMLNPDELPKRKKFQSPYNHQWYPLVPLPYDPQPHLIYGNSFIDPIAGQQLELNALENMKADNYLLRNNPPLLVNRNADVDIASLRFEAGVPWLVDGEGSVVLAVFPDLAESIDNQQQMVRQTMQDRTGANDVLLVSDVTPMKGGESATGASIANENTKLRFQPQGMQIDFFNERIASMIVAMYQQDSLFDRPIELGVTDKSSSKMVAKKINPKDVQGNFQFRVTSLSSLPDSPSMELQKALTLKEAFKEDPEIDVEEINKKILDAAGYDWNTMTKDKDLMKAEMITQITMKLNELTTATKKQGFDPNSPDGQQIMQAISQLKSVLEAATSGQQQQSPAVGTNNLPPQPNTPQPQLAPAPPAAAPPEVNPKPPVMVR